MKTYAEKKIGMYLQSLVTTPSQPQLRRKLGTRKSLVRVSNFYPFISTYYFKDENG
jgi:hypothetical protein